MGRSWGHLGASWSGLGVLLGASWEPPLGGHPGVPKGEPPEASPALGGREPCAECEQLDLSWSERGRSTISQPSPFRSRGVVGGGARPAPLGKRGSLEEGRGQLLDHLSPKGLFDY